MRKEYDFSKSTRNPYAKALKAGKRISLSLSEKAIERSARLGECRSASREEFERIAKAIAKRKK